MESPHPLIRQASLAAASAYTATKGSADRVYGAVRSSIQTQRPWPELWDRFSVPRNVVDATSRLRKNTSYFFSNYVALLFALWVLLLFFHPFSLFWVLFITAAWAYLFVMRPADHPIEIGGRALTSVELAWAFAVFTILVCMFTSVGSFLISVLVFWLGLVVIHSVAREPDEMHVDDGSHPFLSWMGGPNDHPHPAPVGV